MKDPLSLCSLNLVPLYGQPLGSWPLPNLISTPLWSPPVTVGDWGLESWLAPLSLFSLSLWNLILKEPALPPLLEGPQNLGIPRQYRKNDSTQFGMSIPLNPIPFFIFNKKNFPWRDCKFGCGIEKIVKIEHSELLVLSRDVCWGWQRDGDCGVGWGSQTGWGLWEHWEKRVPVFVFHVKEKWALLFCISEIS